MLQQMILPGFDAAISSPELRDGRKPCALPDGPTPSPSGPDRPPVSLSAPQESAQAVTMPVTSAPDLSSWCGPDAPLCCSVSRSPARMLSDALQSRANAVLDRNLRGLGGMIYRFVWKRQDTPHGRQLFLLRPSARPTSANACSSPPSIFDLPQAGEGGIALKQAVQLAGWPTPMAGTPAQNGNNAAGNTDSSRKTVALAGWPTAAASDGMGGKGPRQGVSMSGRMPDGRKVTMDLSASVKLALDHSGPARLTASGDLLTGSSAGMSDGGQLNPRLSAWLMGYPEAWCRAALSCQLPTRSRKARSGA